jgi:hypothetical protein
MCIYGYFLRGLIFLEGLIAPEKSSTRPAGPGGARVSVHYGSSPVIVLVADERSLVFDVTEEPEVHTAAGEELAAGSP